MEPKAVGQTISHYRIEARLGEGGMGVVYRAFDSNLHRQVALKVLAPALVNDPGLRRRFQQEAVSASAISHGHVAHIYEAGEAEGTCFIAMEYVEGETLEQKIQRRRLSLNEILDIAIQVADALDVAHSKGVTHRDIKPSNVMITPRGEVKVLDFGLARVSLAATDATMTFTTESGGVVVGTVQYMSPEQALAGDVDGRSDIFSFGVMLYQLLTGDLPFQGKTITETLIKVVQCEPTPVEEVAPETPAEVAAIVARCTQKERENRYQTAAELLADLRQIQRLQQSSALSSVSAVRSAVTRRAKKRRLVSRRSMAAATGAAAAAAGVGWWLFGRGPNYDSIAVLPFVNSSGNAELEYLSDGLAESIISGISKLPGVTVVSRGSAFRFKGRDVDLQEVARRLNVQTVLTGSVAERDGVLRVSVELSEPARNRRIWGDQFSRPAKVVSAVEEEIARQIAENLRSNLTGEQRQQVARRHTDVDEAYRLYLKGRYHWNKRTVEGLRTAIDFFQQAIDRDPTYALAYAGLADAYMLLANVMPPAEAFGKAKAAVQRTLAIDPNLAEPHTTLGYIALHYDWNWSEAEGRLKRASELNPNYPTARSLYARYLTAIGRFPQSAEQMRRAQQLDPLAVGIATGIGLCYYYARQYDHAITEFRKALDIDPRFPAAWLDLGDAQAQKGQFSQAFESYNKALAITPNDGGGIAQRGRAMALAGRRADAQAAIARLEQLSGERYVSPYFFALIHGGLGDTEAALRSLERGYNERTTPMVFLKVDPAFENLRGEPRFRALLNRMGLEAT
jgi:serine/threonine protein kinase/tetratricopeptide (TPR) repeat protein